MVSKISPRSLEDEPLAGRPQKIETDELQALLHINSAQTEKELAEQFVVTQQVISVRLHTMSKVQKADGFRMNCPKTTKIDCTHFAFKAPEKRFLAQNHYRR